MFETGANRWRTFDAWPPKEVSEKTWYLTADETISDQPSTDKQGFDEYLSDPNNPVPHSANISRDWDRPYMAEDQRFTARRPDVLIYNSEPMESDMTIAGPVDVSLWVSTTESAADFVVKIVDVFPGVDENTNKVDRETDNHHELVRWGFIRGRFHNSFSEPVAFTPNKPTEVKFQLYDVLHDFKRGHKLQIQVQSSMFPFMDMNPQKYVENIFEADDSDFVKAFHRVYRTDDMPSNISFTVLDK